MPRIIDIIEAIEEFAPLAIQESWDNCGLAIGDSSLEAKAALTTVDVTEAVVDEAIKYNCNLIISHHPPIFGGIKQLNGKTDIERALIKAIKHDIAIYASHTATDSALNGTSWTMAEKLQLKNIKALELQKNSLKKLVVFVPQSHADKVRNALAETGAGNIGNYDSCSFNINGTGTFKANENANPYVGKLGELHFEPETRIETIVPTYKIKQVVKAMLEVHPYEEPAYDIYPVESKNPQIGLGVVGETDSPIPTDLFLQKVKTAFNCKVIRHTSISSEIISKVALCGGSGSSILPLAIASGADIFITGDFKYHQFFDAENRIIIADIGHYESEQFTKELFLEIVTKKFSKFAIRLSAVETNPISYLF